MKLSETFTKTQNYYEKVLHNLRNLWQTNLGAATTTTMKKPKPPTIEELEKEYRRLLVSGENPKRMQELKARLDYFNYGIK